MENVKGTNMNDRTMIVLDNGPSRFQFRAAALIWAEGHILIHRSVSDPFWALPGGRVEFHEASAETLSREVEEELGSTSVVGPLRLLIENFFELGGKKAHELGFYYDVQLHSPPPFVQNAIVHRSRDGNADLEFRWALPEQLPSFDLKPTALIPLIARLPSAFSHVVHRDKQ
ncbi:NUDIX hydrolase [Ensifer sesbaniae]|uniref:NUDIX hydrolase n=1 Tax=Ensifer sesbaniae TaxID=1214071 RepID=UPI0035E3D75D